MQDFSQKIPKAKILEDLTLLEESLDSLHPSFTRYRKQEEIRSKFDTMKKECTKAMTALEFYILIAPFISFIGDGHTNILPDSEIMKWLIEKKGIFPLQPIFLENRFFVIKNYSDSDVFDCNCEILSIDDTPINKIINSLLCYVQIDGLGEERKYRKLENSFHILYSLIYGPKSEFKVQYRDTEGNKINTSSIRAITREEIKLAKAKKYPEDSYNPLYSLTILENDIALVKIRSFLNGKKYAKVFKNKQYKNNGKLNRFLKQTFRLLEFKGINKIIIDIRDNDGGKKTNSILLYSYLSKEPFNFYKNCYLKRKSYNFLKKNKKRFDSFVVKTIPKLSIEDEFIKFNNYFFMKSLYKTHKPKSNMFSGEVYILVNGRTFSAAGEFTAISQYYQRAIVIGEETSAGILGNTAGHIVKIKLPYSKIRLFIPILQFNNNLVAEEPKRGIIPDYKPEHSIENHFTEKDMMLEYTLDLIKK